MGRVDGNGGGELAPLEGSTVAGGAASRRTLAKLLGVAAGRGRGFEVAAVAWAGDHIEAEVTQPGSDPVVFLIERATEGRPGFLRCGGLNLYYRGAGLDPMLEAVVRKVAPRALSRITIEGLARLVASDPESGRAIEPVPSAPERDQRRYDERALLSTWGSGEVYTQFFAVAEVARSQLDSLDFFNRCTFVQHCDLECLFVTPQTGVPMVPLVLYPWEDRVRRIDWGRPIYRPEPQADSPGMVTTDLDERDVILGRGPEKLDRLLDHLRERPLGSMVFCSCTCVPVVAGEDVESVVATYARRFPVPLLFLTTTPQSMQGVFRDLLVRRRLEAEAGAPAADPLAVNLIGFPPDPSLEELRELLGSIGARINVALLPALSPQLVDELPRGAINVLHPNDLWRGLYDQIRFDSRIPAVAPPAPFGLRATVEWLVAIADALGAETDVRSAIEPRLAASATEWSGLVEQATRHRLGFVVRASDVHMVTEPGKTWGVPLVAAVDEMGFSIDVMIFGSDEEPSAEAVEAVRARLGPSPRHRIRTFGSRDELSSLLGDGSLSAVYSEHFYDRRLAESGLASFSGQHFERGVGGALRTLRRLLEICRLPFFRRYGRHIRRAARERGLADPFGERDQRASRSSTASS